MHPLGYCRSHHVSSPGRIAAAMLLVSLFLCSGCFMLHKQFKKSVNPLSGTITLKGVSEEIIIRRDSLGIPFVEARNEDDLFFASGYVAAEDRLWQMVMMSMLAQGRLAEITGRDMFKMDLFMRTLDTKKYVEAALQEMSPRALRVLESYSRGVNAYLESHPNLPAEFVLTKYRPAKWTPEDTLHVFCMLNLDVSVNMVEELNFLILAEKLGYEKAAWLFPVYADEAIAFDEAAKLKEIPADRLVKFKAAFNDLRREMKNRLPMGIPASNNWALSGEKTAGGKSIVENDTHLMLMIPNSWMLLHLKCPTYEAAGVTLPGVPFITLGYNGRVAWGASMVMADSQDIFIEKIRTDGGVIQYLDKDRWLPVTERREQFAIKGKKPVEATILETRHGPLLNNALKNVPFPPVMLVQPLPMTSDYGIALSWAVEKMGQTVGAFYDLGRARNVTEARKAAQSVEAIYLNLVFGDEDSIAWQVTGAFPLRAKGTGMLPSPGWTGDYDWTGFLDPDHRPSSVDPSEGFLVTANNRTVPGNFPYRLTSSWFHSDRRDRIAAVLEKMDEAGMEDMIDLQGEYFSLMAEKVQALLFSEPLHGSLTARINGWRDKKEKSRALEALQYLGPDRFDAVMAPESAGAAVMGAFMHTVTRSTFLDELGGDESLCWEAFLDANMMSYPAPEDHLLFRPESPFWDNTATREPESREDIIAEALEKAVRLLEKEIGRDREKWQWGKIHTYRWQHEFTKETIFFHSYFNRGPYPAGGDAHSVNVSGFAWGENFDAVVIPAMRMIVDFSLQEPMSVVTVPGQSGNPSSSHYSDMIPLFLNRKGRPMPFRQENIEDQYRNVFRIVPKPEMPSGG
ncbi:MAG: penicillin acylase family protein [Acidobacteria bacterium]|nr:penicillin acylase family protein [Acidobacteriota bacterium]